MRSLDSLSNFYSMDYAPLISRDVDDPVPLLGALFGAMRRAGYRYDQVSLGPLDPESPRYGQLIAALRGQGYRAFVSFRIGNWFEPIGGRSFDAYMSGRPSVLRNTLQRRRKRLTKSADARITIITGGEQLEDAIRDYQAAYALSWKEPEIFPHFIPDLVRASAQLGCLRLGLLYIDNVPAAAQIWLISGSSAVIYKLAYDPRFQEFSVGSLLTEHLMRWVIERDHVKEVNYGSGDDPYKKEWMSCRREWIGVAAYNARSVRGMAQILAEQGRRLVKTVTQRASDGGSPP